MIEKVADAISISFRDEGYIEGVSDPNEWNEFIKAAEAAIKAMREPTDEMIFDGLIDPGAWGVDMLYIKEVWQAMIDNALKVK